MSAQFHQPVRIIIHSKKYTKKILFLIVLNFRQLENNRLISRFDFVILYPQKKLNFVNLPYLDLFPYLKLHFLISIYFYS